MVLVVLRVLGLLSPVPFSSGPERKARHRSSPRRRRSRVVQPEPQPQGSLPLCKKSGERFGRLALQHTRTSSIPYVTPHNRSVRDPTTPPAACQAWSCIVCIAEPELRACCVWHALCVVKHRATSSCLRHMLTMSSTWHAMCTRAYAPACHKASHSVTSRQPRYRRYTRYRAHA